MLIPARKTWSSRPGQNSAALPCEMRRLWIRSTNLADIILLCCLIKASNVFFKTPLHPGLHYLRVTDSMLSFGNLPAFEKVGSIKHGGALSKLQNEEPGRA
jgi:hypothetical protein